MTEANDPLLSACSPFFLVLASFRRNSKTSNYNVETLHSVLLRELEKVRLYCESDLELRPQLEKLRYALVTTADQVVLTSPWPHRAAWAMRLLEAQTYGTSEGGKRFFQLTQQVLDDQTSSARRVALVLFNCMGLGFQGELRNNRDQLQRLRVRLFEKSNLHSRLGEKMTPSAYDRNSKRNLLKLPTLGIMRFVLVTMAAVIFALIAGNAVTRIKAAKLTENVNEVQLLLNAETPESRF